MIPEGVRGSLDLDDWIARIRDPDAMTYEDAYWGVRPAGPDVIPRLLRELQRSEDGYTRGKFVELLGEMGDASVVPDLIAELSHPDPNVRAWAVTSLEQLGAPEGIAAAQRYREAYPELGPSEGPA